MISPLPYEYEKVLHVPTMTEGLMTKQDAHDLAVTLMEKSERRMAFLEEKLDAVLAGLGRENRGRKTLPVVDDPSPAQATTI
jgi:hypothetical protein